MKEDRPRCWTPQLKACHELLILKAPIPWWSQVSHPLIKSRSFVCKPETAFVKIRKMRLSMFKYTLCSCSILKTRNCPHFTVHSIFSCYHLTQSAMCLTCILCHLWTQRLARRKPCSISSISAKHTADPAQLSSCPVVFPPMPSSLSGDGILPDSCGTSH